MIFHHWYQHGDSEQEMLRKRIVVSGILISGFACCLALVVTREIAFPLWGYILGLVVNMVYLLLFFYTKKVRDLDIVIVIYIWGVIMATNDLYYAANLSRRSWPLLICMCDILLVTNVPMRYIRIWLLGVGCFLFLERAESAFSFGLYKIPGTPDDSQRAKQLECLGIDEIHDFPCKRAAYLSACDLLVYYCAIFYSFYFTNKFAMGMRSERENLQKSVSLAETVVAALVKFDLEQAEEIINSVPETPLTSVLHKMLRNLNQYRPFLPDALFELSDEADSDCVPVTAPLSPEGLVAIVFTDIKGSTSLWEASPDAMRRALEMHNKIIRSCIAARHGYEVKTIGDSFMVAFENLTDAVFFGIEVQDSLDDATWPSDLIFPSTYGWSQVMVRIGVHYGEAAIEIDPNSGRADYIGRIVNKAARLEGACSPGGVAIDKKLLENIPWEKQGWRYEIFEAQLKGIEKTDVAVLFGSSVSTSVSSRSIVSSSSASIAAATMSLQSLAPTPRGAAEFLLYQKSATVIQLMFTLPDEQFGIGDPLYVINSYLSRIFGCIDRSEGCVFSLLSTSLSCGWNTVKSCNTHAENALRCVSLVYHMFGMACGKQSEVCMGVSSGPVHCGRVGTASQKFVTVVGNCVSVAGQCRQAAVTIGTCAISSSCLTANSTHLFRPIDSWLENLNPVTFYEVRVGLLKDYFICRFSSSFCEIEDIYDWGWSDEYLLAFEDGNWCIIEQNMQASDLVLKDVISMIQSGQGLSYRRANTKIFQSSNCLKNAQPE